MGSFKKVGMAVVFCVAAETARADNVVGLGFDGGYAVQQEMPRQHSGVQMAIVHAQLLLRVHDFSSSGKLRNLELVNETTAATSTRPRRNMIFGINDAARLFWRSGIFAEAGAGVNYFGLHVAELTGPMQCTVVTGVGWQFRRKGDSYAYVVEYRATHFSNANTTRPNQGINLHTISVGVNFFYP